jgi:uncharacterized protein
MSQISEILYEANPWWRKTLRLEYKDREIYGQMKKFLNSRQILAFTGLRRVGKTTMLLKIVEDSINEGMDPTDIVFFSFDEQRDSDIRTVIGEYEKLFGKDISIGKHLLVLDEIQKLQGWEDKLKWVYDTYSTTTKILISGSESLFIRKKSKETLAGRLFEFKINTLSFREFLLFKGQKIEPTGLYERDLSRMLNEFIHTQGFPELVGITDQNYIKKYITEGIVEKILYKEIPELFDIRNTEALNAILKILMDEPGQILEHVKLSRDLNISRYSVSKYLEYLENAFLVRKLYNYSKNARKSERSLRKYYPTIISTELAFKEDDLYKSRVFEWLMVNQLDAKFFWRDSHGHEVDMVFENGPHPVEIKYGRANLDGLVAFMEKFNVKEGHIISEQTENRRSFDRKSISTVRATKALLNKTVVSW